MKKKNIDKKVALSIGGLSVLCLGLLFGAWYLSHEPEESFTPAAQEVETLAETWDDKLDSVFRKHPSKRNLFIPVKSPITRRL